MYQLQPTQYQSMFSPLDIGAISQGLRESQQRSDAASQAWAQTSSGYYDDSTYDPAMKEKFMQNLNEQYDKLRTSYSGDLGAATSDLMGLIGGSRRDPYLNLNKVALEKQKERDALKKQFGAKALVFSDLKKGLTDEEGNWRKQDDFNYEVVQDLERDKKLATIIDQSLKKVSREGGLYNDPRYPGILTRKTEFSEGMLQKKNETIYQEYLDTPEGQLHLRILKDLNKDKNPEASLKAYVDNAISNRVSPISISYQDTHLPRETRGSGNTFNPNVYSPLKSTQAQTIKSSVFKSVEDVRTNALSKNAEPEIKEYSNYLITKVKNDSELTNIKKIIDYTAKQLGMSVAGTTGNLELEGVGKSKSLEGNKTYGYTTPEGVYVAPDNSNVEKADPVRSARVSNLIKDIKRYNDIFNNKLTENLPHNVIDDFETLDPSKGVDADNTRDLNTQVIALNGLIKKYHSSDFTYLTGPYSEPSVIGNIKKKLKKQDKNFNDEDLKAFEDSGFEYSGHSVNGDRFKMILKDKFGREHQITPNSAEAAISLAESTKDIRAERVAVGSTIDFVPNSNKYFAMRNGTMEPIEFPKGLTVNGNEGAYQIMVKDKPVSIETYVNYLNSIGQPEEVINNYLRAVSQYYSDGDINSLSKKAALMRDDYDVFKFLENNRVINLSR